MVNEQMRIEGLPKLAMQIQNVRKELEVDASKHSPTQYSILEIALSTFNYGLYLHLRNTRMANRYLEDFMLSELSKLEKLVKEQPDTARLRDRIVNTLQRLKHLQSLQIRKERWGTKYKKIFNLPSMKTRIWLVPISAANSQLDKALVMHHHLAGDRKVASRIGVRRITSSKDDQRQKVFNKWKRVKLQTLQEKYGDMAFGSDMMVGVLEYMEKARDKKASKQSLAEIKALQQRSKSLRKEFKNLRRTSKGMRHQGKGYTDAAVTVIPTPNSPNLYGGLWASFKELLKFRWKDSKS